MSSTTQPRTIEDIRRFNRFYTRQLGLLNEGLLQSSFSLTEGRVMYELAYKGRTTASELGQELGLDAGYLSRILNGFQKRGLIEKIPSETEGRQSFLSLNRNGQEESATINTRSQAQIEAMLSQLTLQDQARLVRAMGMIEGLLVEPKARGLGIGARLVDECILFARRAGYREIPLWTNHVLHAARRLYPQADFQMVNSEPHQSFGHDLISETWNLGL
jgi:DNA-binding MarR family transcriptional regulator